MSSDTGLTAKCFYANATVTFPTSLNRDIRVPHSGPVLEGFPVKRYIKTSMTPRLLAANCRSISSRAPHPSEANSFTQILSLLRR